VKRIVSGKTHDLASEGNAIPPVAGYRLRTATSYGIGTVAGFWFVERLVGF
jgi:hypothetical protein